MKTSLLLTMLGATCLPVAADGQTAPPPASAASTVTNCLPKNWRDPQPTYKSVEVLPDSRVIFRLCAPLAREAKVVSPDLGDAIPTGMTDGVANGLAMTRDATGMWTATTSRALVAQPYRFNFQVDGAPVPDPRGTMWSEQLNGLTSVFEVPGSAGAFQAYRQDVPHGTVSELEYMSPNLGVRRRAHVYTPPGYTKGTRHYPVLYLAHGSGDSDDSWTSIGHAHYILDNLIAAGKAVPMIIVMPASHTPQRPGLHRLFNTDYGDDLTQTLIPLIDRTYRTIPRPEMRAMAGLSMGGAHTLNFGLARPDLFRAVGVFSMGLGVEDVKAETAGYERLNADRLRQAARKMKLVFYAMGKDDFLYGTVAPTRAMLDKYGIRYDYLESQGGHSWDNWRSYLSQFAPKLFH